MAKDRQSTTAAETLALASYRFAGRLLEAVAFPAAAAAAWFMERGEAVQRLGLVPVNRGRAPLLWIHAASVGEVRAAGVLIGQLRKARPEFGFMVSTVTRQGMAVARRELPAGTALTYAPLDLPECVALAVRRARPAAYICMETELWPCILAEVLRQGIPAGLANARMSARSHRRYARAGALARPLMRALAAVCAITASDLERYLALGVRPERARVCGNIKYDQPVAPDEAEKRQQYRAELGLDEKARVLVAGSTRSGEEEMIVAEYRQMADAIPGFRLLIAPRHLHRLEEVEGILRRAGLPFIRFSRRRQESAPVVLVDTMGDLAVLYGLATWVFCGGSLVERGGHNIMEAAARGAPVFHGPHMDDFADAAAILDGNGAVEVESASRLRQEIVRLAPESEEYKKLARAAAETAANMRGAAARQTEMLLAAIEGRRKK